MSVCIINNNIYKNLNNPVNFCKYPYYQTESKSKNSWAEMCEYTEVSPTCVQFMQRMQNSQTQLHKQLVIKT